MGRGVECILEGNWLLVEFQDRKLLDGLEERVVGQLGDTKFDIHQWKLMDFYYYLNAFPQNIHLFAKFHPIPTPFLQGNNSFFSFFKIDDLTHSLKPYFRILFS